MYDYAFIAMRALTRKALPGVLPAADLDNWEQRWRLAYANGAPRVLVQDGQLLVPPDQVRPIICYPQWCAPRWLGAWYRKSPT
jgi:hypothetical protein